MVSRAVLFLMVKPPPMLSRRGMEMLARFLLLMKETSLVTFVRLLAEKDSSSVESNLMDSETSARAGTLKDLTSEIWISAAYSSLGMLISMLFPLLLMMSWPVMLTRSESNLFNLLLSLIWKFSTAATLRPLKSLMKVSVIRMLLTLVTPLAPKLILLSWVNLMNSIWFNVRRAPISRVAKNSRF